MPDDDLGDLTGRTLGDFRLTRRLGAGGMGQVYLAEQLSLKRPVALKLLRPELTHDPVALARFRAEAEASARLAHEQIVQVYAAGEHEGLHYIALEYVEGENLREYLARVGEVEPGEALSILVQLAEALERARLAGIVHRDIKPENVLIDATGRVKVTDFGLSRLTQSDGRALNLTQSGMTLGTPLYMSPEQVRGLVVDHRSDLYSLGVTAYHLLAGEPPFGGATAFEVSMHHVQTPPPDLGDARPDLPPGLGAVVARLLAKRPADRYQTAHELHQDLARVGVGQSISPLLAAAGEGPGRLGAKHLALAAALGLVALAAGWLSAPRATVAGAAGPWPGVDLPAPVRSTRERELVRLIADRDVQPAAHVEHLIEYSLLLVAESRFEEAEARLKDLEAEKRVGAERALLGALARLGRAVAASAEGKHKLAVELLQPAAKGAAPTPRLLDAALLGHPRLAEALAAALDRAAAALGAEWPERLDWLRAPGGVLRGAKQG